MRIRKSVQKLLLGKIRVTVQGMSNPGMETEIKFSVTKTFSTQYDADVWWILKREIIRKHLLNLEKSCYRMRRGGV